METPILAMIPSGYNAADAKLYSILPSDGSGDFTVSVDADATRVNKDGLIEGVALNQARLTYDPLNPECPSLLLEPTVTNNFTYSQDYSQSVWHKSNSTITSFASISPNGKLNASLVKSTGSNGGLFRFSSWTTTQRTISFFVKKENSQTVEIFNASASTNNVVFNLDTGVIISEGGSMTGEIKSYSNNWYRISATYTAVLATGQTFGLKPETLKSVYVWGGQMEENNYVTSYVPTTNTITTRTSDVCKNAGNADLFNVSELSLFIDVNNFTPNGFSYIVLTDGVSSPINMVRLDYTQNSILIRWYNNGTLTFSYDITSVITNQRNKLLISFGIQAKVYFNGILKNTTSISDVPNGFDSLSFTNRTESGGYFQGEVYDARVYDTVLTEAEAIKLTTI